MGHDSLATPAPPAASMHWPDEPTLNRKGERFFPSIENWPAPAESVSASIFEASTEIIRKGEAGKPNEFGKVVRTQEGENQIVVDYEVHDQRPSDSDLLIPSVEAHQRALDRAPHLVAADAAFYSAANDAEAKAMGVKRVSVPNRSTHTQT